MPLSITKIAYNSNPALIISGQILAVKIALILKGLIKEFHMTDMNQTDIEQTIRDQIAQHSVLLYMKARHSSLIMRFFLRDAVDANPNWSPICVCQYS